jgi:hypothetical protein
MSNYIKQWNRIEIFVHGNRLTIITLTTYVHARLGQMPTIQEQFSSNGSGEI